MDDRERTDDRERERLRRIVGTRSSNTICFTSLPGVVVPVDEFGFR